jgi:oxygen-independent coproporphyrinogen-3 oxidase
VRLANTVDVGDYVRAVGSAGTAVAHREEPGPRQFAGEALMLGLRTADGVEDAAFAREHGGEPTALFPDALAEARSRGWVEHAGGRLRLTQEGMLFSDAIFRALF